MKKYYIEWRIYDGPRKRKPVMSLPKVELIELSKTTDVDDLPLMRFDGLEQREITGIKQYCIKTFEHAPIPVPAIKDGDIIV